MTFIPLLPPRAGLASPWSMPRPKRSSEAPAQRAVVQRVEAALVAAHSRGFLNLLVYAYGAEGGLRAVVAQLQRDFDARRQALEDLLEQELAVHERLHELIDHPRRTISDFGPLEKQRHAARPRNTAKRHTVEGDIDTRLARGRVAPRTTRSGRNRELDVELEHPDAWGSDSCDPATGCTSMSRTLHAHAAVLSAIGDRIAEAQGITSVWTPLLEEYPFLESKPAILDFLEDTFGFSWPDIVTFLSYRQEKKKFPIRESYLIRKAASVRTMVWKFRQGQ